MHGACFRPHCTSKWLHRWDPFARVCVRAIKETEILNSNSFIRFSVVPLVLERNPFCVFHLYIYWHLYSLFCLLLSHPWCRWTYNNIRLHNIAMWMAMERMKKKNQTYRHRMKRSATHLPNECVFNGTNTAWTVQQYDNRWMYVLKSYITSN